MSKRTFIAIELNSTTRSKFTVVQNKLKVSHSGVKWVEPKNIHLTLNFLGQVTEPQMEEVFKITDEAVRDISPFPIFFSGLGAFPDIGNPHTVWVGIGEGKETLLQINSNLEKVLEPLGFPGEDRAYEPHLTLGRVKSSRRKDKLIDAVEAEMDSSFGHMEVKEISVMQTILKPEGSVYKLLYRSELK